MEDEILRIIAAELVGEPVAEEERVRVNRWRGVSRENEKMYRMVTGELGEVVRLVRLKGGLDSEKAYERLEGEMQKTMIKLKKKEKVRRMSWWRYGASVAGVLLMLGVGVMVWMKPEEGKLRVTGERVEPGSGQGGVGRNDIQHVDSSRERGISACFVGWDKSVFKFRLRNSLPGGVR